jgi:predicted  nucleic acid-binding Zn-ribbon protein
MRYGNRTEAAQFGDPDAMLARFEPGPDRVARVVLHPRLSFVPVAADTFEAFRSTFAVDVETRIFSADDVRSARTHGTDNADRASAFDEAIEAIVKGREQQETARRRLEDAEGRLEEAQAALARVAFQREQVDAAVAEARARLAVLENAETQEELEARVTAARRRASHAETAHATATERAGGTSPEILAAEAEVEKATRELQRIEDNAVEGGYALDEASHQLEMWAAQRALDVAKFDLDRLRRQAGDGADLEAEIEAAREELEAARAELDDAQAALTARAEADLPDDPAGEARAIRAQIEAVERSVGEAEAAREADVANLTQAVEAARREIDSATRHTERAIERFELDAPDADVEAALEELRHRRVELTADDPGLSALGRVLRDLAQDAPEPLLVFIEPDAEPGEDLIGALISVSGLKRTVVVTDKTEMLAEVREMEPALGAVREPLETSGVNRQELARSDGNRT